MNNLYDELFQKISGIQTKVYNRFTYYTDEDQYGTAEKWVIPSVSAPFSGDCEDFALACRKLCREQKIQSRLVVCMVNGEGHCVLEVNGWILDCNYDHVVSRNELTNYQWRAISGFDPGDDWKLITN